MSEHEWRDPDEIKLDFASGDPELIRRGLAGLREFSKDGDEVEMPAIDASLLRPFGDHPPESVVIDLARLLMRYRSFSPPLSPLEIILQLVEIGLRYAVGQVIYETSIEIQSQADPVASARAAIDAIGVRGLGSARELEAGRKLVGYLLGAKPPVRRAVAEALAAWPLTTAKREVIAGVLPHVDPDQRARLTRDE